MSSPVRAVMFFANEPRVAAIWWATLCAIPASSVESVDEFACFDLGDIEFGFHPSDEEMNPHGGTPVIYLTTDNLEKSVSNAQALGAQLHRGPLQVSGDRTIAQLVDPFGNIFGFDGKPSL